jgi:hypothetical protein
VSGLAYVIARPSFITGSDRAEARPMERAAAAVADAVLGVAGRVGAAAARDKYASMTAGELSRALVALAFDESTPSLVVEAAELRARAALPGQKAAPA